MEYLLGGIGGEKNQHSETGKTAKKMGWKLGGILQAEKSAR